MIGEGVLVRAGALATMLALALAGAVEAPGAAKAKRPTPMIFVHGQSGSAQQFETDAMRFTSNGFPQKRIFAYEYDTNASSNDVAVAELDGFIAKVEEKTGASRVDVLGHSRGTTVMHEYLSTPSRAAEVRRYVNFDGRTADAPPGGVRTLAIWGEGDQTREIKGATNVYFPRKAHTEVTTSRAAFAEVYEFLIGEAPETRDVVAEKPNRVKVAGRASAFPSNEGIEGGLLQVYELRRSTGARKPGGPVYSRELGPQGSFGPFKVDGGKRYELALSEPGEQTIHNYPEPFEHDDYFYRVLNAPALEPFIESGPDHSAIAVTRMREWWGDQPGAGSTDRLELNGLNVINPAIAPRQRRVLAVFNFDKDSDQVTDTSEPLSPFSLIGFLTGVDIYLPSSPDASGTISVKATMRAKKRHVEKLNVPNWPSESDTISVFFRDYAAKEYRPPGR